jgi:hypothetical protein
MNKAYIVLRRGYEYDDNIYNITEGGTPQIVCFSKEDAKQKVKDLNIENYKLVNIEEYGYVVSDLVSCDWEDFVNFNLSLVEKYGPIPKHNSWDDAENLLHPKANKEEIEKFCSMVKISFYEIYETDIDISSWRNQQINSIVDN